MKVLVMPGHTLEGQGIGANGYINESLENRVVAKKVVEYLKKENCEAEYFELNKSNNHLVDQVNYANKKSYDLVVQIHFNANKNTQSAMGTEVFYYDNVKVAKQIADRLGTIYKNRGAKGNNSLYWLKNTKASALLVEVCFVDSLADTNIYKANKNLTAKLIAEGILNKKIEGENNNMNTNKIKIKINGKYYEVEGIFQNGTNYVKVRDLEKANFKIGFEENIATIESPCCCNK